MKKQICLVVAIQLLVFYSCFSYAQIESNKASGEVKIEFRQVNSDPYATREALQGNKEKGFVIMSEINQYGSSKNRPCLVSEKIDVGVTNSDIARIYSKKDCFGSWNIIIVFSKEASINILAMADKNLGEKIAFIMNGDLISTPVVMEKFKLNKEGNFEFAIPTSCKTSEEASIFLAKYYLKIKDFLGLTKEEEKICESIKKVIEKERNDSSVSLILK